MTWKQEIIALSSSARRKMDAGTERHHCPNGGLPSSVVDSARPRQHVSLLTGSPSTRLALAGVRLQTGRHVALPGSTITIASCSPWEPKMLGDVVVSIERMRDPFLKFDLVSSEPSNNDALVRGIRSPACRRRK